MKVKRAYEVKLNWHGQEYKFITTAYGKGIALNNALYKLSEKLEQSIWTVRNYFINTDRYSVELK